MRVSYSVAILSMLILVSERISTGTEILKTSGLATSLSTQTFENPALATNSPIGLQFGDVSSKTLFYNGNPSCAFFEEGGNCVSNFQDLNGAVSNVQSTFSILFTIPQTYAAFAMIQGGAATDTITALMNGKTVDSFTTPIVSFYNPNSIPPMGSGNYYGFANEVFDTIQVSITSGSNLAVIDNIQLSNTAPEPGTIAMMGFGLISLGLVARKLRSSLHVWPE